MNDYLIVSIKDNCAEHDEEEEYACKSSGESSKLRSDFGTDLQRVKIAFLAKGIPIRRGGRRDIDTIYAECGEKFKRAGWHVKTQVVRALWNTTFGNP